MLANGNMDFMVLVLSYCLLSLSFALLSLLLGGIGVFCKAASHGSFCICLVFIPCPSDCCLPQQHSRRRVGTCVAPRHWSPVEIPCWSPTISSYTGQLCSALSTITAPSQLMVPKSFVKKNKWFLPRICIPVKPKGMRKQHALVSFYWEMNVGGLLSQYQMQTCFLFSITLEYSIC